LQGTDSNTGVVFGTDTVQVATGGSTRVTVDSSGKVGIGTSSPLAKLHIGGATEGIRFGTSGAVPKADVKYTASGAEFLDLSVQGTTTGYGNIRFSTGPTPDERMRLDSSGNLFIGGTTAANADIALNANGSATFAGSRTKVASDGNLELYNGTNQVAAISAGDGSAVFADGNITFSGTGSATFAGSSFLLGNYTFNSTTTSGVEFDTGSFTSQRASSTGASSRAHAHRFGQDITYELKNDGSASFASYNDSSTSGFGVKINIASNAGDVRAQCQSTASQYTRLYDGLKGTSTVFSVLANGNLTVSGNVTAANVSDIRFKENITDANPQLADVVDLGSQLKNWDWKDDAPLNEELRAKRFLGLVAQEAEKVCPGLTYTVPRTKRGKELTAAVLNEDGNETKAATYEKLDDSYKAINHDILVMKLLGAVAEQNTQIETLKARVTTLEAG